MITIQPVLLFAYPEAKATHHGTARFVSSVQNLSREQIPIETKDRQGQVANTGFPSISHGRRCTSRFGFSATNDRAKNPTLLQSGHPNTLPLGSDMSPASPAVCPLFIIFLILIPGSRSFHPEMFVELSWVRFISLIQTLPNPPPFAGGTDSAGTSTGTHQQRSYDLLLLISVSFVSLLLFIAWKETLTWKEKKNGHRPVSRMALLFKSEAHCRGFWCRPRYWNGSANWGQPQGQHKL